MSHLVERMAFSHNNVCLQHAHTYQKDLSSYSVSKASNLIWSITTIDWGYIDTMGMGKAERKEKLSGCIEHANTGAK